MRSGLSLLRGNASRRSRGSSAPRENYAFCLRTRHSKGRRGNPSDDMGREYEGKFFRSRSMHDEHCRDHRTFSSTKLRSGIRSTSRIGGYERKRAAGDPVRDRHDGRPLGAIDAEMGRQGAIAPVHVGHCDPSHCSGAVARSGARKPGWRFS